MAAVTVRSEREYRVEIARREREIKQVISQAVRDAVSQLLAADADGGDKLGVKYVQRTPDSSGMVLRAGFRDGIGIDVKVETAYLPELPKAVA